MQFANYEMQLGDASRIPNFIVILINIIVIVIFRCAEIAPPRRYSPDITPTPNADRVRSIG